MRTLLVVILILCLVQSGLSCGKKKKKKGLQNPTPAPDAATDAPAECDTVQCVLGDGVTSDPYNSGGDDAGDCSQLECKDGDNCHWSNAEPPADELAWTKTGGSPDSDKWKTAFGTDTQPDGSYLLTYSRAPGTADQSAQLYSAPITCSQGDIKVKLKKWNTSGTKIQVCKESDPAGPPENCKDVSGGNGDDQEVTIPKADNARIVVQAKGFKNGRDVAAVDDITVTCDPCESTTTPAPPAAETTAAPTSAPTKPPCKEIQCDFESGSPCSYQAAQGSGNANKNWGAQSIPFQNPLTGIRKQSGNGNKFGACYINPNKGKKSKTNLETQATFDKEYVVKFLFYKAVKGVNFKGCCDTETTCPTDASPEVQTADYKVWKSAAFACPAGTKKVIFVCEDVEGSNEGACGIDDIRLMQASGGNPNDASQSACAAS